FVISIWRASDSMTGGGLVNVIFAIGLIGWVDLCRLTRAQVLSLREKEYVLAARAVGAGGIRIAVKHLLPNALARLIVGVTLGARGCRRVRGARRSHGVGVAAVGAGGGGAWDCGAVSDRSAHRCAAT